MASRFCTGHSRGGLVGGCRLPESRTGEHHGQTSWRGTFLKTNKNLIKTNILYHKLINFQNTHCIFTYFLCFFVWIIKYLFIYSSLTSLWIFWTLWRHLSRIVHSPRVILAEKIQSVTLPLPVLQWSRDTSGPFQLLTVDAPRSTCVMPTLNVQETLAKLAFSVNLERKFLKKI